MGELVLEMEDLRTEEERERDNQRAAEAQTFPWPEVEFANKPEEDQWLYRLRRCKEIIYCS